MRAPAWMMTRSPIKAWVIEAFAPIEQSRPMRTLGPMTAPAQITVAAPISARGPTTAPGSIRTPAACSGIVGLKPTFGLVSLEGVFPVSPKHLDTVGPMGKDIAHVVIGMDLLVEGFAQRYEAAKAAKPEGRQIKVGRLYLNTPSPTNLAFVVTDPGSLILGVTDLRNLFYSLTDPGRLLGTTDTRIDQAVDAALDRAGFQVVRMDPSFKTKWAQAQKDANVIAATDAWLHDGKYEDLPGVTIRSKSILLLGQFLYKSADPEWVRHHSWRRNHRRQHHLAIGRAPTQWRFFGGQGKRWNAIGQGRQ